MSYAEATAKGPKQSPEEARAPPPQEVEKTEDSTISLVDVDSPHVSSVPADFQDQEVKTTTQAERLEREAKEEYEAAKKKTEEEAKNITEKAKAAAESLRRNEGNPVILGNAFLVTAITSGLGYGAYRKHLQGELSWGLIGIWGSAVGALAVADYFASKWLFQNKYPTK